MKKLLLLLCALGVTIGANASVEIKGDTIVFTSPTQSDFNNVTQAQLANINVVRIVGVVDQNAWQTFTNSTNRQSDAKFFSVPTIDMSQMDASCYTERTTDPAKYYAQYLKCFDKVILPYGLTKVGHNMFQDSEVVDVVIPPTVQIIEDAAFQNAKKMKHVTLPEGVEHIGNSAFSTCPLLESVHLPSTLLSIGNDAFRDCSEMSQLVIPKNVKTIGKAAFQNSGLKDIFVMSEDLDNIPNIWACDGTSDTNHGTFLGTEHLGTNSATEVMAVVKQCSDDYNYDARLAHFKETMSDEAAAQACKDELKDIILQTLQYYDGRNGKGKIHTMVLHYPASMRSFYDAYPDWIKNGDDAARKAQSYLSDTYSVKDKAGNTWPVNQNGTIAPENMAYSTRTNDLERRIEAGKDPATGQISTTAASAYGWRQLPIHQGFAPQQVLTLTVDDTWYTLCTPYDATDEELAIAFNEGFNIAEFDAARVMKEVDGEEALVFFFTKVSKADKSYREGRILARGGHPYMIHPNKGVAAGPGSKRVEAYLPMTFLLPEEDGGYDPAKNVVTQELMDARNATKALGKPWTDADGESRQQVIYDGEISTGQTFTFYGKNDTKEEAIGAGNYFLGCGKDNGYDNSQYYPMYYKETFDGINGNGGKWTSYTAIIKPSEGADAWLKANLNKESGAKSVDVEFDSHTVVNKTTDIQNVLDEAREQKQPVKYLPVVYNINGQVVRTDSINLGGLPTGLYIVNGKKYFVK